MFAAPHRPPRFKVYLFYNLSAFIHFGCRGWTKFYKFYNQLKRSVGRFELNFNIKKKILSLLYMHVEKVFFMANIFFLFVVFSAPHAQSKRQRLIHHIRRMTHSVIRRDNAIHSSCTKRRPHRPNCSTMTMAVGLAAATTKR